MVPLEVRIGKQQTIKKKENPECIILMESTLTINLNSARDRDNVFHQSLVDCFLILKYAVASIHQQLRIHPTTEQYQLFLKSGHYSYRVILTKCLMVRITTVTKTKAETSKRMSLK